MNRNTKPSQPLPPIPVFNVLRWLQAHPKLMRGVDFLAALSSIAYGVWDNSVLWMVVGVVSLLAAIFRLGDRVNMFLPKIKSPGKNGHV